MVTAIIQARVGSTRLPGKTMKNILGKPMLWHMINRLEKSNLIEKMVIATTTDERDKIILEFAEKVAVNEMAGESLKKELVYFVMDDVITTDMDFKEFIADKVN